MLVFLVYLGEFIGSISAVLIMALIALAIVVVGTLIRTSNLQTYENRKESIVLMWYSKFHKLAKSYIIILLLFIFIPSQKTFYVMVAVYAGTVVVESPEARRIFDKAVSALESKLDYLVDPAESKKGAK